MTIDRNGRTVQVGSRVRVLKVAEFLGRDLPADEWQRIQTMVGEVFEVYEIDAHGSAWVEKWWPESDGHRLSHSLALGADEMEVV